MESVFLRFDSYDFQTDPRFRDGLKVLQQSGRDGDQTSLQDMKLFFYNRFVEPIDRTRYKQWSSASPRAPLMDCSARQPDQETPPDSDSDKTGTLGENQAGETPAETEVTQLSFAEVMQLVQQGKEVPGAIKVDVKPSNQSPTPSQMERIRKPWEIASYSS